MICFQRVKQASTGQTAFCWRVPCDRAEDSYSLAALRKNSGRANIPVIILSIVDQKQVGFALGAADYLIKPVRRAALLEAIRRHVPSPADEDSSLLLVDDDPKALELLEEALRSAG